MSLLRRVYGIMALNVAIVLATMGLNITLAAGGKPRVFVLTDIENEPDDAMSMVRFLLYANHYDIEGLAATTSVHQQNRVAPQRIRQIVEAYGKVRDNLEQHEAGYPAADYLLARVTEGIPVYGMQGVGKAKDSPAAEMLVEVVDRDDPRPVWVTVWGGPNVLAQALWKVRQKRSPEAVNAFVAQLRVYTISDQDDSGPWLREQFPQLFYIASPGVHPGGALSYHWFTYGEAGTFVCSSGTSGQPIAIKGLDQIQASFTVPTKTVMPPGIGTLHIIWAVTDSGTPRLTRYRRVIVDVIN